MAGGNEVGGGVFGGHGSPHHVTGTRVGEHATVVVGVLTHLVLVEALHRDAVASSRQVVQFDLPSRSARGHAVRSSRRWCWPSWPTLHVGVHRVGERLGPVLGNLTSGRVDELHLGEGMAWCALSTLSSRAPSRLMRSAIAARKL